MRIRTFLPTLLLAAAAPAFAETIDAESAALGWQTERADAVVVASFVRELPLEASREAEFRVERSLKGDAVAGDTLVVARADRGHGAPWTEGLPHLLFLAKVGEGNVRAPVAGAFSVRALPEGSPEARFPDLVASLAQTLAAGGDAGLRSLLVTWMEDADAGVAWSAATDFVRHRELHGSLTSAESARVVAAFAARPFGKRTKEALGYAAAATRTSAAVEALADALAADGGRAIRGALAEALRRTGSASAPAALVRRLADAPPGREPALLGALGVVGDAASAAAVRARLASADATVRAEAAAALGGIARNVRRADPEARLQAADALAEGVTGKAAETMPAQELRARLWALAQLDEARAFDVLRDVAARSVVPDARRYAERLLAQPRQSLIQ